MGLACSCFDAFNKSKGSVAPDESPTKNKRVHSYDEAFMIKRPEEGSFIPSPSSDKYWASPAPRTPKTPGMDVDLDMEDLDFDIMIDEQPSASPQVDTDSQNRLSAYRGRALKSKFTVEQLISSPGSLPKAMTKKEIEAATKAFQKTATYKMLDTIPADLLTAGTAHAQTLRRKLARGATIVFVTAGLPGKRFIYERAAAMGIKSVILDHPDSWAQELVTAGVAAKFLPVDMSQSGEEVFRQALTLIKSLGSDGLTGPVDAVASFVELSVPLVARLAEMLGVPSIGSLAVDTARDKYKTRGALKAAGLPTPRNTLIHHASEVEAAGALVGFPAVLKPICGAASLGVKKVTSPQELLASYHEVVKELSTLVVSSGALVQGGATNMGVDASQVVDLSVLLEQYLDGCEVDIDVVMSGGEYKYAAVADNGPTLEPYFNETWGLCPSVQPKEKQKALLKLAIDSVKACGFESGVFHVECKYTSTGPQLIEVNSRMGGGQIHECNLRTWGVDLVEETLFVALGIPARPPVPQVPLECVAYCYVNAKKSGIAGDFSCLEELRRRQDVVWAKQLVKTGASVVGPADGLPTWICDLFVTKPTSKEALEYLLKTEDEFAVNIN